MYEVIFDLETQNWFDETGTTDPGDLKVSVVSLYTRVIDGILIQRKCQFVTRAKNVEIFP
jgi:hypothetical protein